MMTLFPDQPTRLRDLALPRLPLPDGLLEALTPSQQTRRKFGPMVISAAVASSGVMIALANGITDGRLYGAATIAGFGLCVALEGWQIWRDRAQPVYPAE